MSTFSSLFQSGTAFYGDPFGPIIDTISDFGWSLLPQFPGSIQQRPGSGPLPVPQGPEVVILPPVPVAQTYPGGGIESQTTWLPTVLPGPARRGLPGVPRETVIVEGVPTEVERYEVGDFPAGSIFAPGRAWGVEPHDLDTQPPQEEPVSLWGDIFTGVVDTLQGQPWGGIQQGGFNAMGPAFAAGTDVTRPSGSAALPPSAAPLQMISGPGGDCGNRRYVTLDRQTGKITCKRRRRRRLLTNRDLADLASLKTITGGGAALNAAVIRAVR